jgi:hypothetical protein
MMDMPIPTDNDAGIVMVFWVVIGLLFVVVHVMLAMGVYRDGLNIQERGDYTFFVSPTIWSLAVLLTGIPGVGVYWVMHHSTLRRN